ncbi:YihY/virulence factor BrkB family protein [Microlunatus capsulatus]|uniref:Membrane protein n=1 Tax=Microlunatus capsulatus TaxID=99117 RepID=A0ABS4Z5C9_9ACTN|nr:YihY/virulence factor BrkB family protein [Microlunatus capsulatus]MBP2416238.1 membrane protein [Microlunatus capsulatus]
MPDHAPHPAPGEVVPLRSVSARAWLYALRRVGRGFWRHQDHDLAAGLTYHAVLAVFPALVALVSLLGLLGAGDRSTDTVLVVARLLVPAEALGVVEPLVENLAASSSRVVTLVLGVVLAQWFVTIYVLAVGRALNRVFEVREGRPLLPRLVRTVGLTLVLGVLVLLAAVLLLLSAPVAEALGFLFGVGSPVVRVVGVLKWPLLAAVLALLVGLLYARAPNVRPPHRRWVSPGAVLAIVIWLVGSLAFGFYVRHVAGYQRTYGALAGLVVLLVWLWVSNLALLLGAEVDREVERVRQLAAGVAAEERVVLEPRDVRLSEKVAARDRRDVEAGRRLRQRRPPPR